MASHIPTPLLNALDSGTWQNTNADVLNELFSTVPVLPELRLFPDVATMLRVAQQVDDGGFVDDENFCMVRDRCDLEGCNDPRLVFADALFLGGSTVPGDDILIAVDTVGSEDPAVLVFDWSKPAPSRWTRVGPLSVLVSAAREPSAD